MDIKLVPVMQEQKTTLANLYQLYNYDFSEYTNVDINVDGKYDVNIDYFWEGDHRWKPYFIYVSECLAGFVVVLLENLDIDPDPTHVIYDFMILKKYRRNGIGYSAAFKTFDMYRADWKTAQMKNNDPAIQFWRKVIKSYTNYIFSEIDRTDTNKYIQMFSTKV